MKGIWVVSIIASILFLGTLGFSQDVFAPPPAKPEKIQVGPIKSNAELQAFQIGILVFLTKGSDSESFTVETTLKIFKPDGTPIRASASDPVPEGVGEGGNNSSVHKLTAKIPFPPDLEGEKFKVLVKLDLLDSDGSKVAGVAKWHNITLKRG